MNAFGCRAGLLACVLLISACAATTSPRLEQARSSYQATKQNPDIAQAAPTALGVAGKNIERGDAALEQDDKAAADHYAYLAERQVEIAKEQAEQARLQDRIEATKQRREGLQLRLQRLRARKVQESAEQAQRRAAKLRAELRELRAERTNRGIVMTLSDVLFDKAKAELKPGGLPPLDKLADFLHEHAGRRVRIEGYTDSRGSAGYNQDLSERRALTVKSALIGRGIDPDRITAVGLGENYPKADNETAAGRRQNRRVEIVISDADGNIGERRD